MDYVTSGLYPSDVFRYFEDISNIPRGTGNEKAVSDYLVNFALSHKLEAAQDSALNVIIKKPGTKGYEDSPAVIIQGHMDMVCDKNRDKVHDFEKDPIELRIKEDMVYANGTTLGSDDGIAVAYVLALLASDRIPHPPLEVVLTTGEEVGLCGASALNMTGLKSKYLINLDFGIEGKLLAGCAGGVRFRMSLPVEWMEAPEDFVPYIINIRGLKGGHSGVEINLGRGNSNKLLGRVLDDLLSAMDIYIGDISGGLKTNAIPREADALVLVKKEETGILTGRVSEWDEIFKNELRVSDSGVCVSAASIEEKCGKVFSKETAKKAASGLLLIPNGIQSMNMEIKGLVESSINLGITATSGDYIIFEGAIRSSAETLKSDIFNRCRALADILGAELGSYSDYPGWEYNADSKLLSMLKEIYKKMYGMVPEIAATHGGVECGIFKGKMPGLDMVCIGPNMLDVHTPNEHLDIHSTGRVWDFLLAVLKELK